MLHLSDKFTACLQANYITVENEGDYAAVRNGDTLTLYFEWSDGLTDWRNNFDFPVKPYRDMQKLWLCHRGFLRVWKSIEPYIEKEIADPLISHIDVVGYSHGGAIAQLCYEYVSFHRPDVSVSGVGFGAPRVFWGLLPKAVKGRFENFLVVRNGHDIVTHLPPAVLGFRHVGKLIKVGQSVDCIKDHYPQRYQDALLAADRLTCEELVPM